MKSSTKIMAHVLALSLLAGCASFGDVSKLTLKPWPLDAAKGRKSITLAYGAGVFNESPEKKRRHYITLGTMCQTTDELGTVICHAQPGVPPTMVQVFQESGLFSEVKTDGSATDLRADIKTLVRNVQNPGGAVLVGLTLFLAPGKVVDHDLVVRATFKDKDDKVLGKFEGRATGSQWLGLLSVFGLPFRDMSFEETENAAYRAILIEARQKGII
jgi:hypothetical protein